MKLVVRIYHVPMSENRARKLLHFSPLTWAVPRPILEASPRIKAGLSQQCLLSFQCCTESFQLQRRCFPCRIHFKNKVTHWHISQRKFIHIDPVETCSVK